MCLSLVVSLGPREHRRAMLAAVDGCLSLSPGFPWCPWAVVVATILRDWARPFHTQMPRPLLPCP